MNKQTHKPLILFCGGHFSSAVPVIDELRKNGQVRIEFIGRKYLSPFDPETSLEYRYITKQLIPFHHLQTPRLTRIFSLPALISLFKFPKAVLDAKNIIMSIQPDVVVSFGSYVSLPVTLAAYLSGVTVIIHEQTSVLGLANRVSSLFANRVLLSWPNTRFAHSKKTVITGLPIRRSIFEKKDSDLVHFGDQKKPLIFITGGSTGSRSVNLLIRDILPDLLNDYRVLHQCGSSDNRADLKMLTDLKHHLTDEQGRNYSIYSHIPPNELGAIYHQTFIVIGRSGVNTCAELLVTATPSILIPLPWAAYNEQERNARYLESLGGAVVILAKNTDPHSLKDMMRTVSQDHNKMRERLQTHHSQGFTQSAKLIAEIIEKFSYEHRSVLA